MANEPRMSSKCRRRECQEQYGDHIRKDGEVLCPDKSGCAFVHFTAAPERVPSVWVHMRGREAVSSAAVLRATGDGLLVQIAERIEQQIERRKVRVAVAPQEKEMGDEHKARTAQCEACKVVYSWMGLPILRAAVCKRCHGRLKMARGAHFRVVVETPAVEALEAAQ